MLNDFDFFTCTVKVDAAITDLKNTFGENAPYEIDHRLGSSVIVFNKHFIDMLRIALTTGCMAGMNASEELVLNNMIQYQNGGSYRDITSNDDVVMAALDKWLHDEVLGNIHPALDQCAE